MNSQYKNQLALVFGFLLLLGIGAMIVFQSPEKREDNVGNNNSQNVEPAAPGDIVSYRTTLVGEYVCLPHRDTSGPQTMECAFGLRTDDGKYYAVDFSFMSQMQPDNLATGKRMSANGLLTPVEMLSSDRWTSIYNVVGIFSVTDSVTIIN